MIDKNKKLMLVIIDSLGNSDINYFEDFPDNIHYKILRNYILNKSISFSLKYDLNRADSNVELRTKMSNVIETNLYELIKVFTKNGYLLLLDNTDYRQYRDGAKHWGQVFLPESVENLSEVHKDMLQSLSNEFIVDKVCSSKNSNKLIFYELSVFYYDKYSKEINDTGQQLDEVLFELKNEIKDKPKFKK